MNDFEKTVNDFGEARIFSATEHNQKLEGSYPAEDKKPATGKIRGLDERIAWNSAINNAIHTMGDMDFHADGLAEENIREIKARANQIYKLINQGPHD